MKPMPMNVPTLLGFAAALWTSAVAAAEPSYACLMEPYQRIEVRSPVEALIDTVHVDRGSYVKQGQVLVTLDRGVEKAALELSRYRAVMEGEAKVAQARLSYSQEKLRRREELRRQNFISAQDRDDTLAELRVAEADLIQAKDNTQLSMLENKRLEEVLKLRELVAPFNGVVTERLQHPGELSFTGEGARPILKLAQINPVRVEVVLPVALYGRIRAGGKALVMPEPPLQGSYRATVKTVDKVVDSASGTFGVLMELPNPKGTLPVGVKCKVSFGD